MIQRAVTAIIGVVIGLFATFAVFSAILAGLDSFYLLTQDACNYGSDNSPETGAAHHRPRTPLDRGEVGRYGLDRGRSSRLDNNGAGRCVARRGYLEVDTPPTSPPTETFSTGHLPARPRSVPIGNIPWIEAESSSVHRAAAAGAEPC